MKQKILVTGGAGYIGSNAAYSLIDKGYDVIVIDNLSRGHKKLVPEKSVFYNIDIKDNEGLNNIFKRHSIDAVMHFAGYALVGESVLHPEKYYDNNFSTGIKLLNVMIENNVKKIIFSSSCAVYGMPKKIPITEDEEFKPINPYGESKLFFEKALKRYYTAYGIKSVSLRYFNAAGADLQGRTGEIHNPESHLIPNILFAAMKRHDKLVIYGNDYETEDGTCVRDYIHIEDIAAAHILSLEHLDKISGAEFYNLGSEKGYSVLEIIKAAERVTGEKIKYEIGARRDGDPAKLIADSTLIKEKLNWEPKIKDIDTIIESAYRYYKNNLKN